MSIKQKITVRFSLLVAALLLLFSVFIYQTYASYRQNQMRTRLQRRAIAAQLFLTNRTEFLRTTYLTLPEQHEVLFDAANQKLFSSSGPDDYPITTDLLRAARQQETYFSYHSPAWPNDKEGVALSFVQGSARYVSVVTAYDLAGRQTAQNLRLILTFGNLLSLLVIALAGFIFARQAMSPFDGLIQQLDGATVNDFSFRLTRSQPRDEAGYLAESFNQLLGNLEQLASSQENFVAYASHELRTPLTVVKGILETSGAYDQTLTETRQSMEKALHRLEGAIDLANALLQLAEVESLKGTRLQDDINLIDSIFDTVVYFGEKYPQQQIDVQLTDEFTEQSSAMRLIGNATLLRTVLINLIDNACKYSGFQPVLVAVRVSGGSVIIDIIDQGIGIPPAQVGDVFLPMMRASNVGNIRGFGLGLTLARRIIDMHQGTLSVGPSQTGGTTATLRLPTYPIADRPA